MAIKSERIVGKKIICEIESSTVQKTEYDTSTKKLIATFKNGVQYEYDEVPHSIYTKFRMADSQGSFFSKEIGRKYEYRKLPNEDE